MTSVSGAEIGARRRAVRLRLRRLADEARDWLLSEEGEAAVDEAVAAGLICRWELVSVYWGVWRRELGRLGLLDDEAVMASVAVTLEDASRGAAACCLCARCVRVRGLTGGRLSMWDYQNVWVVAREPVGLEWTETSVGGFVRSVERLRG